MSQIIPPFKVVDTKTLDLQGYIKHLQFSPSIHKGVKLTKTHNEKKSYRTGRELKRSAQQRKTKLVNIGLCNLIHCKDGYVKFYTFTTKKPYFNRKLFVREFTNFIRRLERYLGYKVIYYAVTEEHDSSSTSEARRFSYHYHALFFNLPYIYYEIIQNIWGLGFIYIKPIPIENGYQAISYVTKYLTKDSTLNNRVSMSRVITRPIEYYNLTKPTCPIIYEHATLIIEASTTIKISLHKKI